MKVPLLDLKTQYAGLRSQIREAMDRVCDAQAFILGPEVEGLEQAIATLCGVGHAVGVSSGTDALLAALMAVSLQPGDEVVTTPLSFFATAGVVVRLRGKPVFADIDPVTFNLDASAAAALVNGRTRAILPVHLFGRCAELDPLLQAAEAVGACVIEDAAQAIGAFDAAGRPAGSIGHLGCFSFFPSKNLGAFGDGGMVVTKDGALSETLRLLRVHGARPKYYHSLVGGNFRLDALQAAILSVKLPYLQAWTAARRVNAARYRALFENLGLDQEILLPQDLPGHIYNQFVIRCADRDGLQQFLRSKDIETEIYYPLPLHLQKCFSDLGYREGDCPHAEQAAKQCLGLPIFPELTEEQQCYVVEQIRAFTLGRQPVRRVDAVASGLPQRPVSPADLL